MAENRDRMKVAAIGFGAMTRIVMASLQRSQDEIGIGAVLLRAGGPAISSSGPTRFDDVDALIAWKPSLVVECAGHTAVRDSVPALLDAGIDVVVSSVGALGDASTLRRLQQAAQRGGSRMSVVSGAVGGLDVLRAAKLAGLDEVVYTGRKPPMAWIGTPAEVSLDLGSLIVATTFFEGTAAEAARDFPKNANVTATIALAGVGFEKTRVTLIADPTINGNRHHFVASGAFGRFSVSLENAPLPENPRTSWLAALSVEQAIRKHFRFLDL